MDGSGLLVNLAFALLASVLGAAAAARLRQSPVLGYIVAGIAIGPFTPGFVGDLDVVRALADVGVIFLLFTIGAQLSLRDLLRVGPVAVGGGTLQVVVTIGAGYAVGRAVGWTDLESLFFGAVISNSSSTVLGRVLAERGEAETEHGLVALAWSTVQDLGTIVLVVLLTALSGAVGGEAVGSSLVRALLFLVLVVPIGFVAMPRVFELLASFRSREIFVLGVVAIALGTAYLASLFGISVALGAFLAGLIVGGSDLSARVVGEASPFRDVFAGLFFVSVGMLVDPGFVIGNAPLVALAAVLIVVFKGGLAALITAAFRYRTGTAILTGALLAQSAEFSFLLARVGADLGALSAQAFSLLLAAAAISIITAPAVNALARRLARAVEAQLVARRAAELSGAEGMADGNAQPADREVRGVVVCGYGGVGRLVVRALRQRGFRFRVIEDDARRAAELREAGVDVIRGPADNAAVLEAARLDRASVLVVALSDPISARQVVDTARRVHPRLPIVVRTHSASEREVLRRLGADEVVVGEQELGLEMTRFTLRRLGVSATETSAVVQGLRGR